jgi:hypothetical protein
MEAPHHLPLKTKIDEEAELRFKYSSVGMSRDDPEEEFGKARWVVLTSA